MKTKSIFCLSVGIAFAALVTASYVPANWGVVSLTGQTSSLANTQIYTNTSGGPVTGTLHVIPIITTASTVGTLAVTVLYTNSAGAVTLASLSATTTAVKGAITIPPADLSISNNTAIVVSTTLVNTTGAATYDFNAWFTRGSQ